MPTLGPKPIVDRADVERIVRRDFPPDQFQTVMATLDEYGDRERDRVQLAVLKLTGGNFESLRHYVEQAKSDYRDVLAPAEEPAYEKETYANDRLSDEEKQQIIDRDWKQYVNWFTRA